MIRHRILVLTLACGAVQAAMAAPLTPERLAATIFLEPNAIRNLGLETAPAERTTFETTRFAIGRLDLDPARRAVVASRIAGRLVALHVKAGDAVAEGEVVAEVESRQPGPAPARIALRAPRAGTVLTATAVLGQPVEPDMELLQLADLSTLWAIARIGEDTAARLASPPSGRVHIPAVGAHAGLLTWQGWAPTVDRDSGSVAGIFTLANPDGRLRPGMRAEFHLLEQRREGVLSIPRAALQGDAARPIVLRRDPELPGAYVRTSVVTGEVGRDRIEILAGLEAGDQVVTTGAYALQFVGPAAGPSLREALDAAHGHAHAADGSELGEPCSEAGHSHGGHGHDDDHDHAIPWLTVLGVYAAVMTVLALVLAQALWRRSRRVAP